MTSMLLWKMMSRLNAKFREFAIVFPLSLLKIDRVGVAINTIFMNPRN